MQHAAAIGWCRPLPNLGALDAQHHRMTHNPLTRDLERKLIKLRRLADMVETSLVEQAAALDAQVSQKAERYSDEEKQDFFEYHAEDFYELSDELPTILRYSVLTGADTALEVYLNSTCSTYAEVYDAAIRVSDLRGNGIVRARDYLKKVAKVPFPDSGPEWTRVKRLHQLRNAIVHADGHVAADGPTLQRWAPNMPGLRITTWREISLAREFTDAALDAYRAFSLQVDEACEQLGLWRSVFPPLDET